MNKGIGYTNFSFERSLRQYPFPPKPSISPKPASLSSSKINIKTESNLVSNPLPEPKQLSFEFK